LLVKRCQLFEWQLFEISLAQKNALQAIGQEIVDPLRGEPALPESGG
jgi:hypothetical protein